MHFIAERAARLHPALTKVLTPLNIVLALVILGIIAAVIRLVTRGKPEVTSSHRIR